MQKILKDAVNNIIYSSINDEEKIRYVELKLRAVNYFDKKPSAQVAIFEHRPCNLCGELNVENARVVAVFAEDDLEILDRMYEVFNLERLESPIDFFEYFDEEGKDEEYRFIRFNSHCSADVPKRTGLKVWDEDYIEVEVIKKIGEPKKTYKIRRK